MTDEEELRAKISQLAGKINRRKNENLIPLHHSNPYPYPSRPSYRGQYARSNFRGRGGSVRGSHQFKNATLVNTHQTVSDGTAQEGITVRAGNASHWKNKATYEKDLKAKTEIRPPQDRKVHLHEKSQVMQAVLPGPRSVSVANTPPSHFININDIRYSVEKGGSKLKRVNNDLSLAEKTPKSVTVNGVLFRRSKNGNLIRANAVTRQPGKVKTDLCPRFTSTGTCFRGNACRGIHDASKTAICPTFIRTGNCPVGTDCNLSHEPSPEKVPTCTHFLRGKCMKDPCPYAHTPVPPSGPPCRPFALMGFCIKGEACGERHSRECPDYYSTGRCRIRNCTLPHVDRACHMRKLGTNKAGHGNSMNVDDDVSSDEELYDRIDSDDVDSDDFDEPEEVLGGTDTGDLSQQLDFVGFS